jgi:hypothetical protein
LAYEKCRQTAAFKRVRKLLAFLFGGVFALLIGNAATGLAGGLAGSLAFTAAAVFGALAKVTRFQRFDVFHMVDPPISIRLFFTL